MANENLDKRFELIQETFSNPEFKTKLGRILNEMTPSELAYVIESSPPHERKIIWDLIQLDTEGEVLGELDENLREDLLEGMNPGEISAAISDLEVDDLADILQTLPEKMTNEVLSLMNSRDRGRVEKILDYPEESAGGLMNTDVITVRAENSIELVMRYLRFLKELPQNTDDIYVVSKNDEYLGILPITKILTSDPNLTVREVMDTEFQPLNIKIDQIDVYNEFKTKDLFSAPVVDDNNHLLGRITVDDIIEVAVDEVEQDFIGFAQIEEDIFASPKKSIKKRVLWLSINLLTAVIAAASISLFEDVIQKVVYAAILMPIVASMGGIAGSQSLALVIRAQALDQIGSSNSKLLILKESAIGLLNGIIWSGVIAAIVYFWFDSVFLGGVIAAAIMINLIIGAISGVSLPLILEKLDIDPALAGGVILTTITDVVGFVSLLGIATFLM